MTKLLDQAIVAAQALPESVQDDLARIIVEAAQGDHQVVIAMSPEEEASFHESIAQEERGEFVPEDEVRDFWAKIGV